MLAPSHRVVAWHRRLSGPLHWTVDAAGGGRGQPVEPPEHLVSAWQAVLLGPRHVTDDDAGGAEGHDHIALGIDRDDTAGQLAVLDDFLGRLFQFLLWWIGRRVAAGFVLILFEIHLDLEHL